MAHSEVPKLLRQEEFVRGWSQDEGGENFSMSTHEREREKGIVGGKKGSAKFSLFCVENFSWIIKHIKRSA